MPTVLVTGASRGIGLELVRQYATRGWQVIATVRNRTSAGELAALQRQFPAIDIEPLDVAQHGQAFVLANRLRGRPIDVLLHNAGVAPGNLAAAIFPQVDYQLCRDVLETNLWPVLWITEALLANVLASEQRKIMIMSSAAGSIGSLARFKGPSQGGYHYRISKAALNMVASLLAKDLADQGVTVGILSPGQVDTELGRGGATATPPNLVPVEKSVSGLLGVIDAFNLESSGKFIRYTGLEVPF